MKLWTKRDAIKSGIESFIRTWGSSPRGTYGADPRSINVCRELQKLDPETVDAKTVDYLIGNPGWAGNKCDECQQDSDVVVVIPGDYDSTARLCPTCLQKALDLIGMDQRITQQQKMGFYDLPENSNG